MMTAHDGAAKILSSRNRRYSLSHGALDVPENASLEPRFETEFESEVEAECYRPPNFVTEEIS